MKTENYIRSSPGWRRLSLSLKPFFPRWWLVGIIILALSVSSCSSSKSISEKQEAEIVEIKEKYERLPIRIPESKVNLQIPMANLPTLPQGAGYTNKQGQANVKVTAENDTIYIEASCDEVIADLEKAEREISYLKEKTELESEEKKPPEIGIKTILRWFSLGLVIGIIITIITIRKLKK
ncbi:hypothetical protein M2138_001723 [Dysgonomonadaceae bacterium PH5-43]|nr:hypothetical protein [Dysgonomonadaceae bacterium PH5-43]